MNISILQNLRQLARRSAVGRGHGGVATRLPWPATLDSDDDDELTMSGARAAAAARAGRRH